MGYWQRTYDEMPKLFKEKEAKFKEDQIDLRSAGWIIIEVLKSIYSKKEFNSLNFNGSDPFTEQKVYFLHDELIAQRCRIDRPSFYFSKNFLKNMFQNDVFLEIFFKDIEISMRQISKLQDELFFLPGTSNSSDSVFSRR